MNDHPDAIPHPAFSSVAFIGVGRAGGAMLANLRAAGVPAEACLSVFSRHPGEATPVEPGVLALAPTALEPCRTAESVALATIDAGLAEAVRRLSTGRLWVFVLAGLGGRTGSTLTPLLTAELRTKCERLIAFVTLPGTDEGSERVLRAQRAVVTINRACEGVFCLPHDKVADTVDPEAPLAETFAIPGELTARVAYGLWQMLTVPPTVRLHPDDLHGLLRGPACRVFAHVQAAGPERVRLLLESLLAHPLLAKGAALRGAQVALNITGGPDFTRGQMTEIVRAVHSAAEDVHVHLCAGSAAGMKERLGLTLFARSETASPELQTAPEREYAPADVPRFVPANVPAGASPHATRTQSHPPETGRVETTTPGGRRRPDRTPRQTQLALELTNSGRFEKSEPTIFRGENLDIPTYIRRGITLNTN